MFPNSKRYLVIAAIAAVTVFASPSWAARGPDDDYC